MEIQYSGGAQAYRAAAAPESTMPRLPRTCFPATASTPRGAKVWALAGRLPAFVFVAGFLVLTSVRADETAEVRALITRGDLTAAMARADKAIAAQPRDAQMRFLRGVALMDLGRDAEALDAFVRLTQEHPDLPDPYNNIGLLQARAGRPEVALIALQQALRCDPSHRTARANLGQVHLMLAVKAWEQLGRTGPMDPALLRKLESARALLAVGSVPTVAASAGSPAR
jgi:tetratricopeptide (TPR) repeat protein